MVTAEAGWASSIAFSPDGKMFACGGRDHSVRIWDAASANERRRLRGSRDEVRAVAFSPDGNTLVSGSKDGAVKAWSTVGRQPEAALLPNLPGQAFSTLSPGSRRSARSEPR